MYIAVDRHCGSDLIIPLQPPNRHGNIVDHAESLAVVGKCMMKSATDADADSVYETLPCAKNRSPRREPESIGKIARVGNFHLHFFPLAECSSLEFLNILRLMYQKNVLIGRRARLQKIFRASNTGGYQFVANAPVFLGREDVVADRKVIGITVDELEGKHRISSRPVAFRRSASSITRAHLRLHIIRPCSKGKRPRLNAAFHAQLVNSFTVLAADAEAYQNPESAAVQEAGSVATATVVAAFPATSAAAS